MSDSLVTVLKITERCNLNCTYCYYFNGRDQTYKNRPARIEAQTVESIANFLKQGTLELGLTSVFICFHGGEPLLLNKERFKNICKTLRSTIEPIASLTLAIQTNGLLLDNEWLEIFLKEEISVGVSIDGPSKYHDQYRIDFFKQGTHTRLVQKIKQFQSFFHEKGFSKAPLGFLSVVNPAYKAVEIYNHFVYELKVKKFDILLPDYTYDRLPPEKIEDYGHFLIELFNTWVENDDPEVEIRFIQSAINLLTGKEGLVYGIGKQADHLPLTTIYSNGDIGPTDELMSTDSSLKEGHNVNGMSYKTLIETSPFQKIKSAFLNKPQACQNCVWQNICHGGGIVNRYSPQNGFDNPSLYCEALKEFYTHVSVYLLKNGYPIEQIEKNLTLAA